MSTYSRLYSGRTTVGTTIVSLVPDTDTIAINGVQILADPLNANYVWIGASGMTCNVADTTDGFPLASGDAIFIPVKHPDEIFVQTKNETGQKVWWIYL